MVSPEEGLALSVVGDSYRVVISAKGTEDGYAEIDRLIAAGERSEPHFPQIPGIFSFAGKGK
jgi:hypothetical protein